MGSSFSCCMKRTSRTAIQPTVPHAESADRISQFGGRPSGPLMRMIAQVQKSTIIFTPLPVMCRGRCIRGLPQRDRSFARRTGPTGISKMTRYFGLPILWRGGTFQPPFFVPHTPSLVFIRISRATALPELGGWKAPVPYFRKRLSLFMRLPWNSPLVRAPMRAYTSSKHSPDTGGSA